MKVYWISVQPIAVAPEQLRTFSVSRLSGALHQSHEESNFAIDEPAGDREDALALGTLVHAILERLDPLASERESLAEIDRWAESLAPLHAVRRVAELQAEALELAGRFIRSARWEAMQKAHTLRREVDFVMRFDELGGNAILQGYLDALYQDDQGTWRVVDYKTNRIDPGSVPQLAEQYRLQLSVYALAAERALGVAPESLVLCFLRPGEEFTFAWDAHARNAALQSVAEAIATAREAETVSMTATEHA